ncbi:MAG: branched-chain amino acid ABC transporter permease [Rhodobacteraceae bacterium]|nr:branched-chain amino acid ABC transporter permease [Paracoccaceae bacterium]
MIQILIQGLLLSGLYALIAIGFTLIFSVGRVLNLAYGVNLMLGGYAYFWVSQTLGMPKLVGVAAGAGIGILFGIAIHRLIVKPLKSDPVPVEIATLILAVVMQAGVVLIFGDASKILLPIVEGNWRVAGVSVTANRLAAALISWVILIGLYFFIRKTHVGRAISAVSMDVKGAALSGINPDRINTITWGLSGALGGLAGVFFASVTQLYAGMWVAPLIIAVAVVIVGGIGSIWGTLIVAHIIGFMEVITASFMPEIRGVVTMLLIIGVLVMMPKGLFGRGEL